MKYAYFSVLATKATLWSDSLWFRLKLCFELWVPHFMGDFDKLKQPGRRMFCKPHHLRSSCRTGDTLPGEERTEGGVTSGISSRESFLGGQGFGAPEGRTAPIQCEQEESMFLRTCCMR